MDSQASASLAVGVMALPFMLCCGPIGIVLGVVALGLGINSIRQIDASQGMLTGREQAMAGTILGAIAVVGTIAMFVLPQVLFRFF